ncbi:MYB-like transcription factor ETC3 [Primulina tabacum]|uniref:MYB-like transcription factor ETC3 n=1 Tax=Primulina tabacum TaxID=48773 RepID=UPI003F597032
MDKYEQKQPKIQNPGFKSSEEVSSIEWEFIHMTEQEEDIISRMHRLVGDRWGLIAGRVPGRKPEEIERFWLMRNSDSFKDKRIQRKREKIS